METDDSLNSVHYQRHKPESHETVADESHHHHHHHSMIPQRNTFRFSSIPLTSSSASRTINGPGSYSSGSTERFKKKSKRRHKNHKKRQQQQAILRSKRLARQELRLNHERHRGLGKNCKCSYHLIDSCSWPQCNSGCPKLHNPFTG